MLRLSKLGYGRADYYLLPTGVLGNRQVEPLGSWVGRGMAVFGLDGIVTPEEWRLMLSGRDPFGGNLSANQGRVKVVGFDLTFCAPKSVSLLATLGDTEVAERVVSGHVHAVSEAFSYLEEHGLAVRRQRGHARGFPDHIASNESVETSVGRVVLPTGGALGASFLHRTSRALDPHLHTHSVVANIGFSGTVKIMGADTDIEVGDTTGIGLDGYGDGEPLNGPGAGAGIILPDAHGRPSGIQAGALDWSALDWSALDGRGLYAHRSAADALYHAVLRHDLASSLGVEWNTPVRGRADIKGISRDVIEEFSTRQAQIHDRLNSFGLSAGASSRARYVAGMATRPEKDLSISADDLVATWRERAIHRGLGPRQLEGVLDRSPQRSPDVGESANRMVEAGMRALDSLAERGVPVCRRELVRAWSGALTEGASLGQIEQTVDSVLDNTGKKMRVGVHEERHELHSVKSAFARWKAILVEQTMVDYGRHLEMQGTGQSPEDGAGRVAGSPARSVDVTSAGVVNSWMERIGPRPAHPVELAVWTRTRESIQAYADRWLQEGRKHMDLHTTDPYWCSNSGYLPGSARDAGSGPAHGIDADDNAYANDEPSAARSSLARLAETNDLERMVRQTRLRLHMGPEQSREIGKSMELGY
ncbi:MAG: relaxase domain-containing protein [Actinobacteria bacterium]|nr:relaxase domain-containing protein [Actinomycetota bacterium]